MSCTLEPMRVSTNLRSRMLEPKAITAMNEEFFLKTVSSGGDKRSGGVRERQGPGVSIGAAREHVVEWR